jgi:hypothetical protein
MLYSHRAVAAVQAAEQRLQAELKPIILEAVSAEAYDEVAAIARIAAALSRLVKQVKSDSYGLEPAPPSLEDLFSAAGTQAPQMSHVSDASQQEATPEPDGSRRRLIRAPYQPPPPRPRKVDYPRFLRDGDRLVKLAWSKKERRPYEHRAPKAIVQKLLDAVRKRKGEGSQFDAADVLPLMTPTGEEYPSYQSYLALNWLRHVGVVTKIGREGYVVRPGAASAEKLEQFWESLPLAE